MPAKRKPRAVRAIEKQGAVASRNEYLDSLRGLAIVLMVIDHAAGILMNTPIDYSTIRFGTRLSMPLFSILMGYFLAARTSRATTPASGKHPHRLLQILVACVLTNLVFYPLSGVLDILAGLVVCYLLFLFLNDKFVYLIPIILLYPYDPFNPFFDYPLTIVISLVAQGMMLRRFGLGRASISALALTLAGIALISKPSLLVLLFTVPATLLVGLAGQSKGITHPWLALLGRHPLAAYVVQYYVLYTLAQLLE